MATVSPLIVIVGETASGKSDLAIQIAQKYNGEIICADSRTIYKGMDIGTAKPSKEDQAKVPHHLLDIIEPNQTYSVAQFKQDANELIDNIGRHTKLPIMAGGTGLYIDSVLFDYEFRPVNKQKRIALSKLSLEQLQVQAHELGIEEAEVNFANRRHLQRAVEAGKVLKKEQQLRQNTLVIGLKFDKDLLEHRIKTRVNTMVNNGLVDEVKRLGEHYGWESEIIRGIGYRFFGQYIRDEITLEEAKALFVKGDLSLAKRQRTWFKRNKYIHWIDNPEDAFSLVQTFLTRVE